MTPKERARLRGLANGIDTVLQIGKDGIGENLIRQADITLEARELIKGRVLDGCMDYTPRTAAETLAEATGSEVVQVIGSKFVLYRKKSEEAPIKKAETPKKHAKPCQRKRAQGAEAPARRYAPPSPKGGGHRKGRRADAPLSPPSGGRCRRQATEGGKLYPSGGNVRRKATEGGKLYPSGGSVRRKATEGGNPGPRKTGKNRK